MLPAHSGSERLAAPEGEEAYITTPLSARELRLRAERLPRGVVAIRMLES